MVIVTGHRNVDYQRVIDLASGVVDCCNVTAGVKGAGALAARRQKKADTGRRWSGWDRGSVKRGSGISQAEIWVGHREE